MADPWAVVSTQPAPPSPYETNTQFRARMDAAYGPGKWRDTGDWRNAARNRQVGGVPNSDHMKGTPDAPGAHDIVVPGLDPKAAASRLPKGYKGLPEGKVGGQGPHVHVEEANPWAVVPTDPWTPVKTEPVAPAPAAQHYDPRGANMRAQHAASESPLAEMWGDVKTAAGRRIGEAVRELPSMLETGAAQGPGGIASALTLGGLNAAVAPVGGAVEAGSHHLNRAVIPNVYQGGNPTMEARDRTIGDLAEAAVPVPGIGEVNAARKGVSMLTREGRAAARAARTAEEAGALERAGGPRATPAPTEGPWQVVRQTPSPRSAAAVAPTAESAGPWRVVKQEPAPGLSQEPARPGVASASGRSLAASERGPEAPELHDTTASGVIGHEEHPIERMDNAMYRLGRHDVAGKIEAIQALKKVPKEIKSPAVQEELTHALERRLVDPDAPLPPHLAEAEAVRQPWAERQRTAVNAIQERADRGELGEPYEADTGYVPRNVVGKGSKFDLGLPGDRQGVPGRSLSTNTASTKARDFYVVTDQDGNRFFQQGKPHETDIKDRPYASTRQATIAEIEANSNTRYHKNALVNTIDRALHDEAVVRNLDVLAEIKKNLKDEGLAHQFEWHYRNEDGQWVQARANAPRPAGFVEVPHIPQLRGWAFDQRVADVLKDYHPPADEPVANIIQKTNRLLQASMFITPFPHIANVGAMWTVGRGWDWLNPAGYARMMRTGSKAMNEVMTMGPTYRRMLREGSALMSADDATRNFYQTMLESAGHSIENDPRTFRAVADAFKTGNMTPKDVAGLLYNTSHKVLWSVNDMMLLQRQLELEAKGLSTAKAIKEAERWIANYRVPSQVMGQRWMKQLLTDNQFLSFGRYDYGKWRSIGEMVKPFIGKASAAERVDATGKALVLATMLTAGYPVMDYMAQKVTGNKGARVHRGGQAAIVDAAERLTTGQIGWAQAMGSMVSPSPVIEAGPEILSNRDLFTGKELISPESSAPSKAVQAARAAARYFTPGQIALDAMDDENPMKGIAALGGISLPNRDPEDARNIGRKIDQRDAKSRLKRDPLERAVNP